MNDILQGDSSIPSPCKFERRLGGANYHTPKALSYERKASYHTPQALSFDRRELSFERSEFFLRRDLSRFASQKCNKSATKVQQKT